MADQRYLVECRNGYETHVKTDDKTAAESWKRGAGFRTRDARLQPQAAPNH